MRGGRKNCSSEEKDPILPTGEQGLSGRADVDLRFDRDPDTVVELHERARAESILESGVRSIIFWKHLNNHASVEAH
jgi:hypothetical protein